MNKKRKLDYISNDHKDDCIASRFGWLSALLSDSRTIIDAANVFGKDTTVRQAIERYRIELNKLLLQYYQGSQ